MNGENENGREKQAGTQTASLPYGRADVGPSPKNSIWPWIIFAVILLLLGGGIWYFVKHMAAPAQAGGKGKGGGAGGDIPVVADVVHKGDMTIYLDGLGLVQAYNSATIHVRVDGQLVEVGFKEGQFVKKGDVIARIDPAPYQAALDSAKGLLQQDQATLSGAENDLAIDKAAPPGGIAKQVVDDQEALVTQLKGKVQSDLANVESANVNLNYCTVSAPFDGKIGLRSIDVGNIVHAADAGGIAVITQLQPIAMDFSLPQDDLPQVMKAYNSGKPLTVLAMDSSLKNQLAKGELLAIDNMIDPTTGTFKIKAQFENKDNSLVPMQFVNARLDVDTLRGAIIAPTGAVQTGMDSTYVYVVKVDESTDKKQGIKGIVQMRPVEPGHTEGDQTTIDSGLAENEIVVTDGMDKLQDNTKVTVKMQGSGAATQPGGTTRSSRGGRGKSSGTTKPSTSIQTP